MVLCIDCGNTSIKFGIVENEELKKSYLIRTIREKSDDEYAYSFGYQYVLRIGASCCRNLCRCLRYAQHQRPGYGGFLPIGNVYRHSDYFFAEWFFVKEIQC